MAAMAVRIFGPLDIAALAAGVQEVVRRHEALRTTIEVVDGIPAQRVHRFRENGTTHIEVVNAQHGISQSDARRLAQEFLQRQQSWSSGRLMEVMLIELTHGTHALIVGLDHIISDGVSYEIMAREIWTMYEQRARGLEPSLPEVPLHFGDYAVWQERGAGWSARHERYWQHRVCHFQPIRLPESGAAGKHGDAVRGQFQFDLDLRVVAALSALANEEHVRLPIVILTLYILVMSHWCERSDLIVAMETHGRYHEEIKNMIGFVASILHLRISVSRTSDFREMIRQVRQEFRAAGEHRDFDRVPLIHPEATTELYFNWAPNNAVFQWLTQNWTFNWLPTTHNGAANGLRMIGNDVIIEPFELDGLRAFKFLMYFTQLASGIRVAIVYRKDYFATDAMVGVARTFEALASECVNDASCSIGTAMRRAARLIE